MKNYPLILAAGALSACGTIYEQAHYPYEASTRDPAIQLQGKLAGMGIAPISAVPTAGTADYAGGFVGNVGGCGFDVGCDNSNAVYGRSSLSANFDTGNISASITNLVIEYDEVDDFGLHTIRSIPSISTTSAGTISGNTFSGVSMSAGNYYGNNTFLVGGEVDGTFKGTDASGVSANFDGYIAPVTGGYPLGGYESLTGQISALIEP